MKNIRRPILTVISIVVVALSPARSVSAQEVMKRSLAAGGSLAMNATTAAAFLDGMTSVLPMTALVGEVQVLAHRPAEIAAFGGVRQRFAARSQSDFYGQILVGVASYGRRCDLCSTIAIEVGLGGDVVISEHWAIRVRADVRGGGAAGDVPLLTLGAGVQRFWGMR